MKTLSERNYLLISEGAKMCGTLDPQEIFPAFVENLYVQDAQPIWNFLTWCHENDKTFGWGNYKQIYKEYLQAIKII